MVVTTEMAGTVVTFRGLKNVNPVYSDGSAYRPDFLINSVFGKIVLECDEFQHKNYNLKNFEEQNRMETIYKDIQILSKKEEVLFIRYHPDDYKGLQYNINGRLEY